MKNHCFLFVALLILVSVSLSLSGCTRARIPLTKIEVPMVGVPLPELPIPFPKIPLLMSGEGDYRLLSWEKSFSRLCEQIEREYPYTEWKGISWNGLRETYSAKIAEAKKKRGHDGFYLALREFMYSIPDANVRVEKNERIRFDNIGGGFGFAMVRTDDNRYFVFDVKEGSSADKAEMEVGAELIQWNNGPIEIAVQETPVIWSDTPPATQAGKIWEKCKLLGRAPVDTEVEISFINPGETEARVAKLVAEKDDYKTLKTPVWQKIDAGPMDSPLQKKILDGGYGYVHILFFSPTINTPFPGQAFQKIISNFIRDDVPGLIIDLRGNTGGDPELIPRFAGYFVEEETFFHNLAFYSKKEKGFKISSGDRIVIKPFPIHYRGQIVVLVDYGTAGSAEGFASILSHQKNIQVIGMSDTRGAMGVPGGDVRMPGGITLSYPVARSLDKNGQIQIEANAKGEGGITPSVKVPINVETLLKMAEGKDIAIEKAIEVLSKTQ
ncbi:MAG TPA: S41 family peptidase [Candidatus Hydrogenedens sp.]|nr:S41 family peptidase [Candidatus Hydrogenedens sp.]